MELKIKITIPDIENSEDKESTFADIKDYVEGWYPGSEIVIDND